MPNPKTKTVTNDIKEAVEQAKKGMKEFRANKSGILNFSIGKASMDDQKIKENFSYCYSKIFC